MTSHSESGRVLLRALLAVALLLAIGAAAMYLSLAGVYRGYREPVIVDFSKGTSTQAMAEELAIFSGPRAASGSAPAGG